jgi:hypothetical protein
MLQALGCISSGAIGRADEKSPNELEDGLW